MSTESQTRRTRTIEIIENKVLKLHKVFQKVLTTRETQELTRTLQLLQSHLKAKGLEARGPLVTLSKPIIEDGSVHVKTTIMCQLKQSVESELQYPYEYVEEMRIENCLYTRYVGEQNYLQMAHSKLSVYAYENYMNLSGKIFTIFLGSDKGEFMCDIFAEVE